MNIVRFSIVAVSFMMAIPRQLPAAGRHPRRRPAPKTDSEYYTALARTHTRYKVYDKAEECYVKAIEKEKDIDSAAKLQCALARLYIKLERHSDAIGLLTIASKTSTDKENQIQALFELAKAHEKSENYDKAEEAYRAVMSNSDQDWATRNARIALLMLWRKTDRMDEVVKEYEATLAETPDDPEALEILSEVYTRIKPDFAKAAGVFEKLLANEPDDLRLQDQLADCYIRAKQSQKAVDLFLRLLEENPDNKEHYMRRVAEAHRITGNKAKALEWAKKLADSKDPTAASCHRLAVFYAGMEMYEEAADELEKSINLSRNKQQARRYMLMRGQALMRSGDKEGARKMYSDVAKNATDSRMKKRAIKMLNALDGQRPLRKEEPAPQK